MLENSAALRCYRVFGINLLSDYKFVTRLRIIKNETNNQALTFSCSELPPAGVETKTNRRFFNSALTGLELFKNEHWQVIKYPEHTSFFLREKQIHCQLTTPHCRHLVEIRLFGFMLSYWLSLYKDSIMLHASAVGKDNQSVVFIAGNSGGKTSLASAMLIHSDLALLSDDIVRISAEAGSLTCYPSYPQIKLWPDQVRAFLHLDPDEFDQIHPDYNKRRVQLPQPGLGDLGHDQSTPAIIYQLNRSETAKQITFTSLSAQQSFLLIKKNLFIRDLLTSDALQVKAFKIASRIADTVPAFELTYPDGFIHLPQVCKQVIKHTAKHSCSTVKTPPRQ